MTQKIAFYTANLVGRVSGYRFELKQWGQQHDRTAQETDAASWAHICRDIAAAGYRAAEVWIAHVDPRYVNEAQARERKMIAADAGIDIIALAAPCTADTARVAGWMEVQMLNGGLWGTDLAATQAILQAGGLRWNFENHPEKSAAEILEKIGGGSDRIGVCIDTGWLGTQGVDAPALIRELGALVRHVHVKDVLAGTHETCLLGQGAVNVEGCLAALKAIGYTGWYSWEDEPEGRNPMDSAVENRQWLEERV
jgi:sugar phosphate isomerase/epimerase